MYPVTTFVHLDDIADEESVRWPSFQEPNANSTFMNETPNSALRSLAENSDHTTYNNSSVHFEDLSKEGFSGVGHTSHIPRIPPVPGTYSVPSIHRPKVPAQCDNEENLFGMVKLRENDVCYTSGTIEWVGRKRSFPINSGFKILDQKYTPTSEPVMKKTKNLNTTFTSSNNRIKECDCADVLPTVNAIVDHLNALHEAVDLVDLRLNTLEDTLSKN